ncbi:hypothetical protein [Cohnella thailandensis]|uniref:Uncharacterized protein n=1 Tax=Cohnella thailandensis TaxID=557557 RepID=A0A841T5E3_9BACL|nr:hypothetical protein [Cohnella thailandensis]MBB6638076.1 hypothetical protein [Cohnella thailandensis]MBP1971998.1 hypothetical protein [Cohnella thailandensis]
MYEKLIAAGDRWTEFALARQDMDGSSRFYGGVSDLDNGIAWPTHTGTGMYLAIWACALSAPESARYRDAELAGRLELAASFMLRQQHADGTISPGWTNLHSPPDTAFVAVGMAQALELLERQQWPPLNGTIANLRLFLERTAPALLTGGCHTPNHRWVMSAALGYLYRLTGRAEFLARAEEWLAEGMDITADGEWTERSNGIYNGVSDIMLLHAADLLGKPELVEPVRRNLRMMAYLVHPDGEVVTDYSGRQDFGHRHDLSGYLPAAAMLAHRDRDPFFAALAKLAGEAIDHPGSANNNALLGFLLHPEWREETIKPGSLPTEYRVVLNRDFPREAYLEAMKDAGHGGRIYHSRLHPDFGAPVARERSGSTSLTVMAETNSFFALRHGAARLLGLTVGSSFEPGFVRMNRMEASGDGYRLSGIETKGYYGPVPSGSLPASASGEVSPWYLLPHHLRETTHLQEHRVEAELIREADGWTVSLRCPTPEPVVTQVSFLFGLDGSFAGGELEPLNGAAGEFAGGGDADAGFVRGTRFWKGGEVRYASGSDWFELSGGAFEHRASALRNAELPSGCQALVVNLLTPFDRTFRIRMSPSAREEAKKND